MEAREFLSYSRGRRRSRRGLGRGRGCLPPRRVRREDLARVRYRPEQQRIKGLWPIGGKYDEAIPVISISDQVHGLRGTLRDLFRRFQANPKPCGVDRCGYVAPKGGTDPKTNQKRPIIDSAPVGPIRNEI